MKTIFNTCVEVTSQEQANRLKQVCIDNGLQIWDSEIAFRFDGINVEPIFEFDYQEEDGFGIYNSHGTVEKLYVTESEWMELLEQHNKANSMYTLTQEQVNELVQGKSIQEVLPEAFKLEVGKWYKTPKHGKAMFFITEIIGDAIYGYGLNSEGTWRHISCFCLADSKANEPATREEVEAMLIAEAKKRGFVEGANVKGLGVLSLGECMGNDSGYYYDSNFNWLLANISLGQNAFIFEKGQWATIVPESKSKSDILTELIDYATTNDNLWLKNQLERLR